jgi:hypothetical protein
MAWRKTFQLKDILSADEDHASVTRAAIAAIERIEGPVGTACWRDGFMRRDMVNLFKIASESGRLSDFNYAMDALYDYADDERVWIT